MGKGRIRKRGEKEEYKKDRMREKGRTMRRGGRRKRWRAHIRSHEDSSNVYLCSYLELLMLHEQIFCGLH